MSIKSDTVSEFKKGDIKMHENFENLKNGHVIYVRIDILCDLLELIHREGLIVRIVPLGINVFQVTKE